MKIEFRLALQREDPQDAARLHHMMLQMLEDIRDGPANMAGGARGSFLKMEGGKVSSVFHIAEEECKSFLTALCTRMSGQSLNVFARKSNPS